MAIRLQLPTEPAWIDLPHGVRVRCRPLTTATNAAAMACAARKVTALAESIAGRREVGMPCDDLPDLSDPDRRDGYSHALYAASLGHACILEWQGRGIEDPATDQPAPLTAENIGALMLIPEIARAFVDRLWRPLGEVVAEGNVCAPSPDGSTAPGASTAEPAVLPEAAAPTAA